MCVQRVCFIGADNCRGLVGFVSAVLLVLAPGCIGWHKAAENAGLQSQIRAAYVRSGQPMPLGPYARHYERGWKQAYHDVARGSNGSVPTLPPAVYTGHRCPNGTRYRNIAAWYSGYECGLNAARVECGDAFIDEGSCSPVPVVRSGTPSDWLSTNGQPVTRMQLASQPPGGEAVRK